MSYDGLEVAPSRRTDDSEKIYRSIPSQMGQPYDSDYTHAKPAAWNSQHEVTRDPTRKPTKRSYVEIVLAALIGFVVAAAALGGGLGSQLASCQRSRRYNAAYMSFLTSNRADEAQLANNTSGTRRVLPDTHTITVTDLHSDLNSALQNCKINSSTLQTSLNSCLSGASVSPSNYSVLSPAVVQTLALNCPAENNTVYTVQYMNPAVDTGATFQRFCNYNYNDQKKGTRGLGLATHLMGIITYTPEDCMTACDNFNAQAIFYGRQNPQGTGSGNLCWSISWTAQLSSAANGAGGNCWLINDTIANFNEIDTNAVGWISANMLSLGKKGVWGG